MIEPGRIIDRYVVEAQIGAGGMATVFRVRHATLGTRHALKVLQSVHPETRRRMLIEAQVQAKLRHPNVVAASDVLDIDGHPGLLMDYIHGPSLDEWLRDYRPPHDEALALFRGIVAGVGYAHSQELVHRDLKPANIMLRVTEHAVTPMVTDFGLAKVTTADGRTTRSGSTFGTPTFMAPEQIRDASTVDRRADLYSLGCILYELFCGRTPHVGDDLIALFTQVASGEYPDPRTFDPDIPRPVLDCIDGLVEADASRRIQDCADVLSILDGRERSTALAPVKGLGPPRPMPPPGVCTLTLGSAGGMRAATFVETLAAAPLATTEDWDEHTSPSVTIAPPTPSPSTSQGTVASSAPLLFGLFSIGGVGAVLVSMVAGLSVAVIWLLLRTPTVAPPVPAPQPDLVATVPNPVLPPDPAPPVEPEPEPPPPVPAGTTVPTTFHSRPKQGAKVWIDQKYVGVTPLVDVPMSQGNHLIRLQYANQKVTKKLLVHTLESKTWSWNFDTGEWDAK